MQPVVLPKGLLEGMELVAVGQTFHGSKLHALTLNREHQAGSDRLAVGQDGAGPAHPVLATQVGSGQTAVVAQGIGQGTARLHPDLIVTSVHIEPDFYLGSIAHAITLPPHAFQ